MSGAKVAFEDWHVVIQTVAFIVIATFFVVFTVRALIMKKDKIDRMASMPLQADERNEPEEPSTESHKSNQE